MSDGSQAVTCRVCGAEPVFDAWESDRWRSVRMKCSRCDQRGDVSGTEAEAIAAWNAVNFPVAACFVAEEGE